MTKQIPIVQVVQNTSAIRPASAKCIERYAIETPVYISFQSNPNDYKPCCRLSALSTAYYNTGAAKASLPAWRSWERYAN